MEGEKQHACQQCDLAKLQVDYAWKWFAYHAEQRTKMFNFMLIAMGVFATATVSAYTDHLLEVAAALCFLSALFAFSFSRLDKRNEELVRLGEEVLSHLERAEVFATPATIKDRAGGTIAFGILHRQASIEAGIDESWQSNAWRGKHRFWLPNLERLIALVFLAAGASIIYAMAFDP